MEEIIFNDTVKEKLIIAGITELEVHGFADFSLRRVASTCNVSCAAPYKHFKDKDHFINEIMNYVDNQWLSLYNQVTAIFENDKKRQLIEMCIAFVRFCSGNMHFRSVFMMNLGKNNTNLNITESITKIAKNYFCDLNEKQQNEKLFKINSLVLGAVTMSGNDPQKNQNILDMLRSSLENEI